MKIYLGPYINRWTSQVHYNYMNKKYDFQWGDNNTRYERLLERLEDTLQWIYNKTINLYLDNKQRKVKVKIHNYDTWSVDDTLAIIILPMLIQLKATKHGSPNVDESDVPEELWAPQDQISGLYYGETDDNYHKRWDWAMDEMIYAFDCKVNKDEVYMRFDDKESMDKEQERISNGFRLFGKYFESLWD